MHKSFYISDDNAHLLKAAEETGNLSNVIVELLRERFEEKDGALKITVKYHYSDEWRKQRVLGGKTAPRTGVFTTTGKLPEILLDYATISETEASVYLDARLYYIDGKKKAIRYEYETDESGKVSAAKHGIEFDNAPACLEDFVMAIKNGERCKDLTPEQIEHNRKIDEAITAEEAKEREKKDRRQKEESREEEERVERLRKWGTENGSDLLKARIEENLDWIAMAEEEWADDALVKASELELYVGKDEDCVKDNTAPELETIEKIRAARVDLEEKAGLKNGVHFIVKPCAVPSIVDYDDGDERYIDAIKVLLAPWASKENPMAREEIRICK